MKNQITDLILILNLYDNLSSNRKNNCYPFNEDVFIYDVVCILTLEAINLNKFPQIKYWTIDKPIFNNKRPFFVRIG